jgi:tetratricopeptide (TPR) repeat protein
LWASLSLWQGFYWANDVALSTHVVEVNPRSYLAHVTLGNVAGATERYDEAMAHFRAAQPLAPPTQDVRFNMAQLLLRQGRDEEAVRMLREAVADHPNLVVAHFNLANALMQQNRFTEAIQWYESALQIQPDYAPARKNLLEARQRETRR